MTKAVEKLLLILFDFVSINLAFFCWAWIRKELGLYSETDLHILLYFSVLIFIFWFLIFMFLGLYGSWYAQSRIDEIISICKIISYGVFVIFLITFDLQTDLSRLPTVSRMFIVNYWLLLIIIVPLFRVILRTIQRALLNAGIGLRRTIIVGWDNESWELSDKIRHYPALGYQVIGFVEEKSSDKNLNYKNIPVLGNIDELEKIANKSNAQEVIVALKGSSRRKVLDVLEQCNGLPLNFKIVPDLYDIVMGQARTNQIYGLPLIDIMPHFMPEWERKIKRFLDVVISSAILLVLSPLWILISIAIKIDSAGPILYKQRRVGKNGKEFTIYKYRSMIHNAESQTGPQWAQKKDPRITRIGRIIRRPRMDEVPQFINVLKGEMSLIGPRPERPYFVDKFKKQIPFYTRRLKVQPGITGWAQIKGEYDTSIENVKTKLQYDLFYLENMSLRMDFKILVNTIYVMLIGKGH